MKEQESTSGTDTQTTLTTFSDFLGAMQRLFKIGVYYPEGHVILDKALDRCMHHLIELAEEKAEITFLNNSEGLSLEGVKLSSEFPFAQEFRETLSALSIMELSIQRQINRSEMSLFLRNLLQLKSKVSHTRQFKHFNFDEFPPTITIRQKEFLTSKTSAESGKISSESTKNLFLFIESLAKLGLNNQEIEQCKKLIESLPKNLTETSAKTKKLPTATWDDVARILAKSLNNKGRKGGEETSPHAAINALASILEEFEKTDEGKKSRDAIHLLISTIKKTAPDESVEKKKIEQRTFPIVSELTVEHIQTIASKYKVPSKTLSAIQEFSHDREIISIILQLCQTSQPPENQIRIQHLLRDILSKKINEKKWEIISNGLFDIIKSGVNTRISFTIRNLVEPLRTSRFDSSLHLFLLVAKLCNKDEKKLLWPYLVNELLVQGSSKDSATYLQLCYFASTLSLDDMRECLTQLESQESFQDLKIASDIFHGVTKKGFPLFAFLIKTSIERYVGDRIIGGLRKKPMDWLIEGMAPLLNMDTQTHKLFLYSYLRQSLEHQVPKSLQTAASDIIIETLTHLPPNRRDEPWTIDAIKTLGKTKTSEALDLLKKIITAKKMLLLPEWPLEQRKAAEIALSSKQRTR